ncbi:MAG: DUF2069 domain-containing protein [Gammaproteobacteria bacterium]
MSHEQATAPDARLALAFRIALAAALAEILLVALVTLRSAPPEAPLYAGLLWAAVKCAPLVLVLPGLARGRANAAVWLCFLLCAYFLTAVLAAMDAPPRRWLGLLEVGLVAAGFVAGLLAARWARQSAASSATGKAEGS